MIAYESAHNVEAALTTPLPSKIEAVITCVNCSDFLAYTLPYNQRHFDRLVVITAPEDKATQKVCSFWGAECVLTDEFRTRWGQFCKGAGVNAGLEKLDKDGWVTHMDCDIVLPPHFRSSWDLAELDPTMIYGMDRLEFKNFEDFHRFIADPEPQLQNMFIHTTATGKLAGIATRVGFDHTQGWLPIGYWQTWSPSASGHSRYPQGHTNAAREDVLFPNLWPRSKRSLFAEALCYHLESEDAKMGTNWQTRQTKPFNIDGSKQEWR